MTALILIHGRGQAGKDPSQLKAEWLQALNTGLANQQLQLPIDETEVRFPYYGDVLRALTSGASAEEAGDVIIRGAGSSTEDEFVRRALQEIVQERIRRAVDAGELTLNQLRDLEGDEIIERGALNWQWVQRGLEIIDRYIPFASGAIVATVTRDVHVYLSNPGVRDEIETGIERALDSEQQNVVVAHSLGTVVAYNLLRREGTAKGWKVPLLVTLGSPLGISAISEALRPVQYPQCVKSWFNAMDDDDVVSLYPLDDSRFPVASGQQIENHTEVDNDTPNQHGISGYLKDAKVSHRIHAALS